jgi:hypothetical protein
MSSTVNIEVAAMEDGPQDRIEQLEKLVWTLRHELRGAITPASLIADRLLRNSDPKILHFGTILIEMVERILAKLDATYEIVPAKGEPTQPLDRQII